MINSHDVQLVNSPQASHLRRQRSAPVWSCGHHGAGMAPWRPIAVPPQGRPAVRPIRVDRRGPRGTSGRPSAGGVRGQLGRRRWWLLLCWIMRLFVSAGDAAQLWAPRIGGPNCGGKRSTNLEVRRKQSPAMHATPARYTLRPSSHE